MQNTVIDVKKGAKGCFGTQGKRAYCFNIEVDSVIKENGAFDPLYRVSQDVNEIVIHKDGIPIARVKYSRRTGKWSTQFILDEDAVYRIQLNVKSYSSLKHYLTVVRPNDMFMANFRQNSRMLPYRIYAMPSEAGKLLATKEMETVLFLLDDNITHEEATHEITMVDDQGNRLLKRQMVLLTEEGEHTVSELIRLYQLEAYSHLRQEGIDPYSTLAEIIIIETIRLSDRKLVAYSLERDRYDQPSILRSTRHK